MTLLLFVAQLPAVTDLLRLRGGGNRLLCFVIALAFVAGLMFDAVCQKLRAGRRPNGRFPATY